MNIIQNHIHMDRIKCRAVSQSTLEDDINLPETSPDMSKIIFREGNVLISETKVTKDHVAITGILELFLLYLTEEEEEKLARAVGKIPFEENVYVEGAEPGDMFDVTWNIEDLSVSTVNSRKISARSILTFQLQAECLYDEEAAVDLEDGKDVEYHLEQMEVARLAICKKDIFRIRQDFELPSHMPNIYRLIWQSAKVSALQFKPLDDKIAVSGEVSVFLLYESPQEDDNIQYYETMLPVTGTIDCVGSREMMIPDITWNMTGRECEVRPDMDGEERGCALELVLDLGIKMYAEETVSILSDVYGIRHDIESTVKDGSFRRILVKNSGTCRLSEKLTTEGNPQILQLVHSEGEVLTRECTATDDGIQIEGTLCVKCLYVTSDDKMPYASLEQTLPFAYLLEAKGMQKDADLNVHVGMEQLSVSMLDATELEAKISLDISCIVFEEFHQELLTQLSVMPPDKNARRSIPGIVVHVTEPGETLWQIGKRYYQPVAAIRELNGISGDTIRPGEKLILVKGR